MSDTDTFLKRPDVAWDAQWIELARRIEDERDKLQSQLAAQQRENGRLREALLLYIEVEKHGGYGIENAQRKARAALAGEEGK